MFFVGIYAGPGISPCAAVFLEFSLKTLKRRYRLREIRLWSDHDAEREGEIAAAHADPRYTVMRRVFSQDRRPSRNVPTPPTMVMHFPGEDTAPIDRLRARNIPVEGIAIRDGKKWGKENYKTICLGNNYFVSGSEMKASMLKVVREKRLFIDEDLSRASAWKALVDRIDAMPLFGEDSDSPDGSALSLEQRNMLIALSLPVWFRETIRPIRRY